MPFGMQSNLAMVSGLIPFWSAPSGQPFARSREGVLSRSERPTICQTVPLPSVDALRPGERRAGGELIAEADRNGAVDAAGEDELEGVIDALDGHLGDDDDVAVAEPDFVAGGGPRRRTGRRGCRASSPGAASLRPGERRRSAAGCRRCSSRRPGRSPAWRWSGCGRSKRPGIADFADDIDEPRRPAGRGSA